MSETSATIQGYLPTITDRGEVRYAKFGGGLTANHLDAYCVPTILEAFTLARRAGGKSLYSVPSATAVDGNAMPAKD